MTRINTNLDPKDLSDQHLVAEYRELPMVHAALRRSLKTKSVDDVLKSIPKKFCLNAGHVKFFYNKLAFLDKRYSALKAEMIRRGMHPDPNRILDTSGIPYVFFKDASFDSDDHKIICERISERVKAKPGFYRMQSQVVDVDEYSKNLTKKYCKK